MTARVKYFQFYESLYNVVKDLSPEEFKQAIMPLLEYAFTDQEHVPSSDRFLESIFTMNVPFINKLQENIMNGKKGGAPEGNKNAKGHGAPKGNSNAKKNKQPNIEKETETETSTDTEKETETETETTAHASASLGGGRSEPDNVFVDVTKLKGRGRNVS